MNPQYVPYVRMDYSAAPRTATRQRTADGNTNTRTNSDDDSDPSDKRISRNSMRRIGCVALLGFLLMLLIIAWIASLYVAATNDNASLKQRLSRVRASGDVTEDENGHSVGVNAEMPSSAAQETDLLASTNTTALNSSWSELSWDMLVGAMLYNTNPDTGMMVAPVNAVSLGVCPVGFHPQPRANTDTRAASQCVLNITPGNDIDTTLMIPTEDLCVDPEMYANGKWILGDRGNRPPWPSRTWDTIVHTNEMMLATIQRTELQEMFGREDIQQMVNECVRARAMFYAAVRRPSSASDIYARIGRIVDTVVPSGEIKSYAELSAVWGRLAAFGAIHPLYTSIERKHPGDHRKRMVFISQSGILGGTECADLDIVYGTGDTRSVQTEAGRDHMTLLQEITRLHGMPSHTSHEILRLERALCGARVDADTDDFVQYVQHEISKDTMSYTQLAQIMEPYLSLDAYYTGMAEVHGMDANLLLASMRETEHWVLKAAYVTNIARIASSISLKTWTAYCRVAMLYEIDALLTGSSDENMATDTIHIKERTSSESSSFRRRSIVDTIHIKERAYLLEKTGSARVRPRGFGRGFSTEWMMPNHPIRKPLWHASTRSRSAFHKIPAEYRAPIYIKTAMRSEQGSKTIQEHNDYVAYAEQCTLDVYQTMPDHLDRLFTQIVAKMADMQRIVDAIKQVRDTIDNDVVASDFSEETKTTMRAKLRNVRLRVGSQDMTQWNDPASILAKYLKNNPFSDMPAAPSTNDANLAVEEYTKAALLLHRASVYYYTGWIYLAYPIHTNTTEDAERVPFTMPASIANAWYSPQDPSLNIAAGIITNPLFDNRYSPAALYAKLVTVVAHEFAHMFDDSTGIYFDEFGNVRPWMAQSDQEKWSERVECIVAQFSARTRHLYRHNGRATVGEAMADTMAINWAYKALNTAHPSQTSANITAFAIMYAQVWADASSPASDRDRIANDEHPVPEFRINKVLENFEPLSSQICNRNPKCTIFRGKS